MVDVYYADGKNTTTIELLTTKTSSSNLYDLSTTSVTTNLDSIYTSYKPLILTATQLLRREPTFNGISPFNRHTRRSLLPFLGDALSWLTGTATTKDVSSIKKKFNH